MTVEASGNHPLIEYLETFLSNIPNFYDNVTLALLCYRFLPELSQHVINRLMYYSGPLPFHEVRSWFMATHKAVQNKTLWRLKQLQILQGRGHEVWINPAFHKSLVLGFSSCQIREKSNQDLKDLDQYARSKWENVLYELVKGQQQEAAGPQKRSKGSVSSLEGLLKDSGLLSAVGKVTNSGFQFLLRDVSNQIWTLLIHHFGAKSDVQSLCSTLEFIGDNVLFNKPGDLVKTPKGFDDIELFENFGLLLRKGSDRFQPTRLFTSLSAHKNELDFSQAGLESRGFLVVETNYRVYAYTSSPLQIATLALFIRVQDRFPNLVYGQLDMETVQSAMDHGINADQIIRYLQLNVHPCMTEGRADVPFNGIPFTIIDQIKLWELNRNRLAHKDGYLYQQFLSEREFDAAFNEAKNANVLLYAKLASRILIVTADGHEHMKAFLKSFK